jgi:hypothetical protein
LFLFYFWPYCLAVGKNTPKATENVHHNAESPLACFSTPKRHPIKDVFEVWLLPHLYIFSTVNIQSLMMEFMGKIIHSAVSLHDGGTDHC